MALETFSSSLAFFDGLFKLDFSFCLRFLLLFFFLEICGERESHNWIKVLFLFKIKFMFKFNS